jgi:hypothetical protein
MFASATRRLVGTSLALLALATAACGGGDDTTGPGPGPEPAPAEVQGAYVLTQVRTLGNLGGGGSGLPVTFVDGAGHQLTFVSGTLSLAADGRFDLSVESTYKGDPVTFTDYGTYSATGGSIAFNSEKSTPRLSSGSLSGSTLTAQSQFGGIPFEIDAHK